MNSGLHGEIGLILLAQGQHPMPTMNHPAKEPKPRPSPMAAPHGRPNGTSSPHHNSHMNNNSTTGGWIKNAVKTSGKPLGLPLTGIDNPRQRKGEEAVLFSTDEALAL